MNAGSRLSHTSVLLAARYSRSFIRPGTRHLLNLHDGEIFKSYVGNFANAKSLISDDHGQKVYIDHQQRLWVDIAEVQKDRMWFGTFFGGSSMYSEKLGTFETFREADGLLSNIIRAIVAERSNGLRVSTNKGVSRFDLFNDKFKNYNAKDGLPSSSFKTTSYSKNSREELSFSSLNGMVRLFHHAIKDNKLPPKMVLIDLTLFTEIVKITGKDELLSTDMSLIDVLKFNHEQNIFTIEIKALNFIISNKKKNVYKLEGFKKDWYYLEHAFAIDGNLRSDILRLRHSNIKVGAVPPPWKTRWVYILYILITVVLVALIVRLFRIKALLTQEEELHQLKSDLITNVSHMILTPLTLILGSLGKLHQETIENVRLNMQISLVKANADRLLHMVSEMMDFRDAESGHIIMQVTEANIVGFVHKIYLSFQVLASGRNVTYTFESSLDLVQIYFDCNQLEKVILNLLSNAFKFTSDGGEINVSVSQTQDTVQILVKDNGKGISRNDLNKLFNIHSQVSDLSSMSMGTGIGLALSKSIMELHGGSITVNSNLKTNYSAGHTCFTVTLKCGVAHFKADQFIKDYINRESPLKYCPELPGLQIEKEDQLVGETEKPVVLIVYDNMGTSELLVAALSYYYTIHQACNGREAFDSAIDQLPDLIISDVMMPEMDGLELCKLLKTDQRTSHVPVILLTGRNDYLHQVNALETGADAYVIKPFSIKLLELSVRNFMASRNAMRNKYAQEVTLQPSNTFINSTDERFLKKMVKIVEEHMDNTEFEVSDVIAEIGMSKRLLYKNLQALTNMTVADFVKSVRLKKAAMLLLQGNLNIADVAYSVGFNDRKYFSKEFKKVYGKSPSKYMEDKDSESL